MVRKEIDKFGTIRYLNEKNQFHRADGPAVEYSDGDKYWYINGMLHREDGPAAEFSNGDKYYYIMEKGYSYEDWLTIKNFPLLW